MTRGSRVFFSQSRYTFNNTIVKHAFDRTYIPLLKFLPTKYLHLRCFSGRSRGTTSSSDRISNQTTKQLNYDAYASDKYKDQFRPSVTTPYSREDKKAYEYTPSAISQQRQGQAVGIGQNARDAPYNNSGFQLSYGQPNSSRLQYNKNFNLNSISSQLKPIRWTNENLVPFEKVFYQEHPTVAKRSAADINKLLQEHEITLKGNPPIPKPIMSLDEITFPHYIRKKLSSTNIIDPTGIQKIGWPIALMGRDIIGISRTGSGKTLAFLLPALIHLSGQPPLQAGDGPVILVVAPTRELVTQIHSETIKFCCENSIRATAVYGGTPKQTQASSLNNGVEILIGCPGRLLDFLSSGVTNLKRTTFLVLDEADRMLDMGFEPQIRQIVSQIRPDRQTLMYSATWPESVALLSKSFCREDPVMIKIGSVNLHANPDIIQNIIFVSNFQKKGKLLEIVREAFNSGTKESDVKILIFCTTKRQCNITCQDLIYKGISATEIHGDKTQSDRDYAVKNFRSGEKSVLVATDVASRGLDINDVSMVINYDLPTTIENYVHRIGRTARAGKKGLAITFFPTDDKSRASYSLGREIAQIIEQAGQVPPQNLFEL